jgi:hypothetical protein
MRALLDALERIAKLDTWCDCVYGFKGQHAENCPTTIAREALAAHRGAPLVGDEALRATMRREMYGVSIGFPYVEGVLDLILRLVDEHIARGQR